MDLIKLIDQNVECVATPNGRYLKRSEVFDVVEKFTSTNSAMVPCPGHRKGNVCEIHAHDWLCGNVPCMLSVAQHQ